MGRPNIPAEPVDVDADALYRREGVAVVDPEQPGIRRLLELGA